MRMISKIVIPMALFLVIATLAIKMAVVIGLVLAICLTIKIMFL